MYSLFKIGVVQIEIKTAVFEKQLHQFMMHFNGFNLLEKICKEMLAWIKIDGKV